MDSLVFTVLKLDQFHLRCLRKIAGIKWQDRTTNVEVLQTCKISGMEALLLQLTSAVPMGQAPCIRMPDNRIPKQTFYGQLESGMRLPGWPVRRYKDTLKINLKRCGINPNLLNSAAMSRSSWRSECHQAIDKFEETRETLERKRAASKYGVQPGSHVGVWPCDSCSRICTSRIGLYAHQRTHPSNPSISTVQSIIGVNTWVLFSTNKSLYLANDTRYRHGCYGRRIGTHTRLLTYIHTYIHTYSYHIHRVPKKGVTKLMAVTSSNVNRFSKFFYYWKEKEISNKTHEYDLRCVRVSACVCLYVVLLLTTVDNWHSLQ